MKNWSPDGLLQEFGKRVDEWVHLTMDRTVRLAVTGLNQSGKTVFTTALVHHLLHALHGSNLPLFQVTAENRLQGTRIMLQPDMDVPTFQYDQYIRALLGNKPLWPTPTDALSEIRLAIRFRPSGLLSKRISPSSTLYLDVIDYPGEWLLDLPLLPLSFDEWSAQTFLLCTDEPRKSLSQPWREYLATIQLSHPAQDDILRQASETYTQFLMACKQKEAGLSFLQPGRFTIPGDLKGAPLLTFSPLPPPGADGVVVGSLREEMGKRFDSYKKHVVETFFNRHFAKFDRQIVLLDILNALNRGPGAFADMQNALESILESFRYGPSNLITRLFHPRIDKLLFVATKADFVAANQHHNMERLLRRLVARPANDASFLGVEIKTQALSSFRCTRTVVREHDGRRLSFVQGTPKGRNQEALLFPGEIPENVPDAGEWDANRFNFMEFEPRRPQDAEGSTPPHIRLDQALEFLLGDKLR
ncbi:MAG: YcjX family protein [Magnetococcales bacterium]|nr:YcjX family protein [Magnetococcales bacterium]